MNYIRILKHGFLFGLLSAATFCGMMFSVARFVDPMAAFNSAPTFVVLDIFFVTLWVYARMRKKYKAQSGFLRMLAVCLLVQTISFPFYAYAPAMAFLASGYPGGPDTVAIQAPWVYLPGSFVFTLPILGAFYLTEYVYRWSTGGGS